MNELYTTLQILRFLGLSTARRLVKQFRPGTDYLYEASIRFNEVLKAVPMQIFSFYASLPIQVLFLKKNVSLKMTHVMGTLCLQRVCYSANHCP